MMLILLTVLAAVSCRQQNVPTTGEKSTGTASTDRTQTSAPVSDGSESSDTSVNKTETTTSPASESESVSPSIDPTETSTETPSSPSPTKTPTTDTPVVTPSTETPFDPFSGTLYENRIFITGALPSKEGRSFISYREIKELPDGETAQPIRLDLPGRTFSFEKQYALYTYNENGEAVRIGSGYSDKPRFATGARNELRTDLNGAITSITLNVDFLTGSAYERLDRSEAESELTVLGKQFLSAVFPGSYEGLTPEFFTYENAYDENPESGFIYKGSGEQAIYVLQFSNYAGELLEDCGVRIAFNAGGVPVPSLAARRFSGIDPTLDTSAFSDLTKETVLELMKEGLPDLLTDGVSATNVYFRTETLRFTTVNGRFAATVEAVIDLDNGMQIETGLCFIFDER